MAVGIKIMNQEDLDHNPDQKKVWNTISAPWRNYVIKKLPIIVEFLKGKKGKIIDFGCGTGRNMLEEKDSVGKEYYGIDFSKGQLRHAKKYAKDQKLQAKFFEASLDKLDKRIFKNKMFDYGLFISTLHCLETEDERKDSLKEFFRILKPGAEALISVWNLKDQRFKHVKNGGVYMSWYEQGIPQMRYYYLYKRKEFLDIVRGVGFKILEIYKPTLHDRFSKKNLIVRVKR
jgi:tRNA (uracil-5-)-methyltransferase TRM9